MNAQRTEQRGESNGTTAALKGARLFPEHLLHAEWVRFEAAGYKAPVTGVVYRGQPRPTCGMPLGGLDTGCVDIEANGMLGYSTLFNHLVKPRLLLNAPFMGLSVGDTTWALVSDRLAKRDRPIHSPAALFPSTDYSPAYSDVGLEGVRIAKWIDYWGHYPILDMEYETDAPISVGVRAWSPFIPGDTAASMMPAACFEIHLRNATDAPQEGAFAFTFPGFEQPEGAEAMTREPLEGALNGVCVAGPRQGDPWEMSYVVAALDGESVRIGGPLACDGPAWAAMGRQLPEAGESETGATVACDFSLDAGEAKTLRLVFAWYAPHWRGGGAPSHIETDAFSHMYAKHYLSAQAAAEAMAANHEALLSRVIAWQEAVHAEPEMPGWLADALINNLHLITECGVWGQAKEPIGAWCRPEDGLFGMNECPRGCPQIECLPCSFYGNVPVVYFFPDAALSTLRGYMAYQFDDGRPPWIFSGCTAQEPDKKQPFGLASPVKGYQTVLNGACYAVMLDRLWRVSEDDALLREFWDSMKRCTDFSMNLRPAYGHSQVVAMPTSGTDSGGLGDTEWFEAPEPGWRGYTTHAGGVRMAQVAIVRRMAEAMRDADYAAKCDAWLEAGAAALEEHLWTGRYYLNFHEPETGEKSELVFGYQLDGQWIARWHGVPGVFPDERVATTLDTLRLNCDLSQSGAVNYANPDGTRAKVGGYGPYSYFPPELMMLAMTYMYEGRGGFGLDLLRRCMHNITCRWAYTWDAPNIMRGDNDTGQRTFGADYYQDMMLWAVPAALRGEPLTGPCCEDGLVARVLAAGA